MSMTWGSSRKANEVVNLLGLLAVCLALWANTLVFLPHKHAAQPVCQPHEHTDMWVEPMPSPAEPPVVHDYDQNITVTPGPALPPVEQPQFYTSDTHHNVYI